MHEIARRGLDRASKPAQSCRDEGSAATRYAWLLSFVVAANAASSLLASLKSRGLYGDGAAYLVGIYGDQWFLLFDTRTTVQVMRQAPIVFLSRYTSATLFECGQVFTFTMLILPTALCALCWFTLPQRSKTWILFPLTAVLVGFPATSINAIGEAAIAASYYWILLHLLLFHTRSLRSKSLFLLLCVAAFRLHEGAFLLTIVLLIALATRERPNASREERMFVGVTWLLLLFILTYQIRWVIYPQFSDDRERLLHAITHFEFLFFDRHFNLPLISGGVALLALTALGFVQTHPNESWRYNFRAIMIAWVIFVLAAILTAVFVEQSFSPYSQNQARYFPIVTSALLGMVMIVVNRFGNRSTRLLRPPIIFILVSLCVAQTIADFAATHRWNSYVADLQSRLYRGHGLIPWETTLHSTDEGNETNWRLLNIGWVVPFTCIVFSSSGVVKSIISPPEGTTFRPIDLRQPSQLPRLRGIDYALYERYLAEQAGDN